MNVLVVSFVTSFITSDFPEINSDFRGCVIKLVKLTEVIGMRWLVGVAI